VRRRRRLVYSATLLGVIALGLASRRFPGLLFAPVWGKYPGGALWALMVFLLWGIFRTDLSTRRLAACALMAAYVDEFSQIYQAPWINAIRATTLGDLILGSTFSWRDMLSYTVGVAVGVVIEKVGWRWLFERRV
jgi:hypothetical protein